MKSPALCPLLLCALALALSVHAQNPASGPAEATNRSDAEQEKKAAGWIASVSLGDGGSSR